MSLEKVAKVCIVGAGTMGTRIGLMCAARGGYNVAIYDISEEAIRQAPERQKQAGQMAILAGTLTEAELEAGLARTTYTTSAAEAAAGADILSESVAEVVAVKREVHAAFDRLLPPHAVMTTNTSSLLVSDIEDAVSRRDRFAALHFHGGLGGSLADIMRGPMTSDETVAFLKRFARSIGEVPIVMKKEKGGYLYNTLLGALLRAALGLVTGGYADPEDVDRAWMLVTKQPAGPFGWMDFIGLNIIHDAMANFTTAEPEVTPEQIVDFLRPFIERGDLGAKTGRGFYTHPEPAFMRPDFLKGEE